jgi:3-isopropylmalate/(R)-2-methylmalate dehydratase small subunit
MRAVRRVEGVVAVLDRPNVDTDQIIPKQFLKRVARSGYGPFLFYDWRYRDAPAELPLDDEAAFVAGLVENPEFELNRAEWRHAPILLAGRNFGCGSSREHAVWALEDWGVRAIVAPSFSDIFRSNALQVGLVPARVDEPVVRRWMEAARSRPGLTGVVDVEAGLVEIAGESVPLDLPADARERLLRGLDDIGLTLERGEAIAAFEARRPRWMPSTTALLQSR